MLKIQFAKRYPWDLHKAVILKLYAARIGAYFSRVSASVRVCVRVGVRVSVRVKNYKLPSFEGTAKTRCHVNNFACISHLSKAGFPATATARPSAAPPPYCPPSATPPSQCARLLRFFALSVIRNFLLRIDD